MKFLWKIVLGMLGWIPATVSLNAFEKPAIVSGDHGTVRFGSKVAIYIPSTIKGNVPCPKKQLEWTKNALRFFSSRFGGATSMVGQGAWQSDSLGMITESITVVMSFCSTAKLEMHREAIKEFALAMKTDLGQEMIAVEFAGTLELR